jgi:hypothetical protein
LFLWPLRLIRESIPTFEGVEWATDGLGVKHGVKEEASEGPKWSIWVITAMGCCFDFRVGVDLTSCRFCLSAAVTLARRFLFFWWDILGVDGAMVGVCMEGRWVGVGWGRSGVVVEVQSTTEASVIV